MKRKGIKTLLILNLIMLFISCGSKKTYAGSGVSTQASIVVNDSITKKNNSNSYAESGVSTRASIVTNDPIIKENSGNRIKELESRIEELENTLNKIPNYNQDKVYKDSLEYYKNARDDAQNRIDHFISSLQWVISLIVTMLAAMIGFLQFRNEKQLTKERKEMQLEDAKLKKEIRSENRRIKKQLEEDKKELEGKILMTKNEITSLIKKHEKEIQDIKIEIKKDVEIVEFNSGLSAALNKNTPEEKIIELKKLKKLEGKFTKLQNSKIYFEIAYQYGLLGQNHEEISNYSISIELDPTDPNGYYNRALSKSDLGDKDGALIDYNEAIKLDSNNEEAHNNRAELFLVSKQYKLALVDLIKCVRINKKIKLEIDISQSIYDAFKTYLEDIKDKNELQQEVYNRLLAKEGFTIIEE